MLAKALQRLQARGREAKLTITESCHPGILLRGSSMSRVLESQDTVPPNTTSRVGQDSGSEAPP